MEVARRTSFKKSEQNLFKKKENSVEKEDGNNVKANLKESNVRHRVNSLDFELGSDFYRPFKENSIQKDDQNESNQSKSTEKLKIIKASVENDKKSNDTKSEETTFIIKSECLEITNPKSRRQRPVKKVGTGGNRNRSKTFTLESPSIDLGTPKFSDPPPALKVVHSCNYCSYTSDQMYRVKIHERIHTGEKPFACKICTFTSSLLL